MPDQRAYFYVASTSLETGEINKLWKFNEDPPQPYQAQVWFPRRFHTIPTLSAHITKINGHNVDGGPLPVELTVTNVGEEFFEVEFTKLEDGDIYQIDVAWSAKEELNEREPDPVR